MRTESIYGGSLNEAQNAMSWAAVVITVDGGNYATDTYDDAQYMGFESIADYEQWEKQN